MYRLYLSLQVCTGIKESKFTTSAGQSNVDVNFKDWILPKVHHRLWVRSSPTHFNNHSTPLEAKFALRHLAGAGAPGGPRGMARALRDRVLSG